MNSQLGNVGYTMAVEYVFYFFFGLFLFAILSVLAAERFRVAGRGAMAERTEVAERTMFAVTVLGIVAAVVAASMMWRS